MKKIVLSLVLVVFCSFAFMLTGCNKICFDEDGKTLTIGLECDYSPFNWTETEASDTNVPIYGSTGLYAEGYDIQIARRIASELGYELVVKKIEWDGLIPALKSGDIDLIIAGMSPTEERKEQISFTNYYYSSNHVVIVRSDSAYSNATHFTDFAGATVVGQKGTSFEKLASQLATEANATLGTPLATVPLIVSGILNNVIDATVVEKPVALGVCAQNSSLTYVTLQDQFDVNYEDTIVSIGVRKVDTSLLERVNTVLASITEEQRDEIMLNAVNSTSEE